MRYVPILLLIVACRTDPLPQTIVTGETNRVWVGPEFYANRLMDWRLNNGRIECVEGSPNRPMRTLHLLTRSLGEEPGDLQVSVRMGALAIMDSSHANTWSGFLLGAGGGDVDYRISSLVHHWPGEDGGLIVAVDGTGRIVMRSNTNADGPKGPQSNIPASAWPELPATERQGSGAANDLILTVHVTWDGDAYLVNATVHDGLTGMFLQSARYLEIAPENLSGNVALVSHHSAAMEGPGYWFEAWELSGSKVLFHPDRSFGPILGTQYTASNGVLKLTAQMPPLGAADAQSAVLQADRGTGWEQVGTATLQEHSYTMPFRVEEWTEEEDIPYRVVYELDGSEHTFGGVVRAPHIDDSEFVLASLNCQNISQGQNLVWNHSTIWYPHADLARGVELHDPDMLFFAGDQIYEGGLAGITREPLGKAVLDYHYHWYRFVWAFRDLMRNRPTVTIPDDHDVYHGNIWGDGGIRAEGDARPMSDNGGYIMQPAFVNMVHETQVSHLPDPFDPTPIAQDISVYYTHLQLGGISFAIVADRMFKSTPRKVLPQADIFNGWPKNPAYDATVPTEAALLGPRQLAFLEEWAQDYSGDTWAKVLLSQTLFANLATLPSGADDDTVVPLMRYAEPGEYIADDHLGTDMDSNGWPQTGRNRALRIIRKSFAFHVAGDQHLGSLVRYGIDDHDDGAHAFISPAIANVWPRRWFPPKPGANREPEAPLYTGQHLDGFGNRITVLAVANPVRSGHEPSALYDRVPGYGIVRLRRASRTITAEAWPRWVDAPSDDTFQYTGWPLTFNVEDNYGLQASGQLPALVIDGPQEPVVRLTNETTGELVYTLRVRPGRWRAKVFDARASYSVHVEGMGMATGLRVTENEKDTIHLTF